MTSCRLFRLSFSTGEPNDKQTSSLDHDDTPGWDALELRKTLRMLKSRELAGSLSVLLRHNFAHVLRDVIACRGTPDIEQISAF